MVDKRSVYWKAKFIMNQRIGQCLTLDELKAIVSMEMGSSAKSVENAIRMMGVTKLIKDIGNAQFEVIGSLEEELSE